MQAISGQLTEFADNEQFYMRQQVQQTHPGQQQPGGLPQMFSPQVNHARLLGQQQQLMHGMEGGQDLQATYLLKQKMEAANAAFGHQQQGLQPQQAQQQLLASGVLNAPPGVSLVQQGVGGMAPPPGALPPQLPLATGVHGSGLGLAPVPLIHHPNHLLVREVWANNLTAEFASIRRLVDQYNVIALTTEFVGTIVRPIGNFRSKNDYHYQTMRTNIDLLNPVQIGLSLSDAQGNKPDNVPSTWQFNFLFDMSKEMVSPESLDLLKKSGVAFDKHQSIGVNAYDFAQLLVDSGLLLTDEVTWVSFHAAYDFGFLVNILTDASMPNNKEDYEFWVQKFLPSFYDLNVLSKAVHDLKGQRSIPQPQHSLESLADELGIPRFPLFNTTGGQSLLALLAFVRLAKFPVFKLSNGSLDFAQFKNSIYGINKE
ncbi:ABR119Cp [Eremothecium gossypii ATCC 10895]|uniref:poly(A)-specific ribonuclease n=1 Tax=Eremothecium gossypii (strain ATCC 10895 / CBS 109.51 / FGSC 9923 / NRRL Y-1056) TaxID=284811 RepID=Q75DA5_EREGS|nr:ABR119Cp [Eremothecium gossypii ATCC 10895]AAS50890.2 ABR119Cp [Eremothecium gossypii ATCC 10895]AEY95179.1 FABR119Cp [Eremothecium gossypii FDAG1]